MGSTNEIRESATELAAGEPESGKLEADLENIATSIWTSVRQRQGQSVDILAVLRLLEHLHQEIRDGLFQDSLPDNRQALYALLRDIEQQGGWPYIHRMKLQAFLSSALSEPATKLSDVD